MSNFLALTHDLTALAREGALNPGVDPEDFRYPALLEALLVNPHKNVLVVGPPASGKTHFVHGLVQAGLGVSRKWPHNVIELPWNEIRSCSGDAVHAVRQLVAFLRKAPHVILFIDGIVPLMDGRLCTDNMSQVAHVLWPVVRHLEIRCVGTLKTSEFEKVADVNPVALRSFVTVHLDRWSRSGVLDALHKAGPELGARYGVTVSEAAINSALLLGARYMEDDLPQAPFTVLRAACQRQHLARTSQHHLRSLTDTPEPSERDGEVAHPQVVLAINSLAGVDVEADARAWAASLVSTLQRRVIGQDRAVCSLAWAYVNASLGAVRPFGPGGVFVFAGPAGVGKATLARTLTKRAHADGRIVLWDFATGPLAGDGLALFSPENGAAWFGARRKAAAHLSTIVLVRGLGRAPANVAGRLAQVFRSGWLHLNDGEKVSCKDALFIVTEDIDTSGYQEQLREPLLRKALEARLGKDLVQTFDCIIPFAHLDEGSLLRIARHVIQGAAGQMGARKHTVKTAPAVCALAVRAACTPERGANGLLAWTHAHVMVPMQALESRGAIAPGATVLIDARGDEVHVAFGNGPESSDGATPQPKT